MNDEYKIKTDNIKLWLNDKKYYISRSLYYLFGVLESYIKMKELFPS